MVWNARRPADTLAPPTAIISEHDRLMLDEQINKCIHNYNDIGSKLDDTVNIDGQGEVMDTLSKFYKLIRENIISSPTLGKAEEEEDANDMRLLSIVKELEDISSTYYKLICGRNILHDNKSILSSVIDKNATLGGVAMPHSNSSIIQETSSLSLYYSASIITVLERHIGQIVLPLLQFMMERDRRNKEGHIQTKTLKLFQLANSILCHEGLSLCTFVKQ